MADEKIVSDELVRIKSIVKKWPSSLDEARKITGIECTAWDIYTLEPRSIMLSDGTIHFGCEFLGVE